MENEYKVFSLSSSNKIPLSSLALKKVKAHKAMIIRGKPFKLPCLNKSLNESRATVRVLFMNDE